MCAGLLAAGIAVMPAAADDKCKPLVKEASIPLTQIRSGHVTVPVTMMDRPVNLLFDTGGGARSLSSRVVHELGLKAYASNMGLRDLHGKSRAEQVTIPSMIFAGVKFTNVMFLVEPEDIDTGGRKTFDGIFAPDMLNRVDVDLDFGAMTLNIFSQDHCDGRVVYWPASAIAVIPFDLHGGKITLPVMLDGKRVTALLDTGAVTTVMDVGVARSRFDLNLDAPDVKKDKFSEDRYEYLYRFKTLTLDGITMNNPAVKLIPNMMGQAQTQTGSRATIIPNSGMPEMLLGLALLRKLHVYIAYKEHKLYMTAATPAAAPPAN